VEFRVLGLLEVVDEGRPLAIGRGKESALLALLLLRANEPVTVDQLVDQLWGEEPPDSGAKAVQIYVSRLRARLDRDRIATTPGGYLLRVADGELDSKAFLELATEGHAAVEAGDPPVADSLLTQALALWRGPALADFRFDGFAQEEIRRLDELRDAALADRIDMRLACGRAQETIPELEAMIERTPLSERPRGQLMRALYLSGRQIEALELYQRTRALLAEELGLEPGPEIRELQRRILDQDPTLGPVRQVHLPQPRRRATSALRKRGIATAGLALPILAAAAGTYWLVRGSPPSVAIVRNSVAAIDPATDRVVADVPVGDEPTRLSVGGGDVWSLNAGSTVSRIDAGRVNGVRTFAIGPAPGDIAYGAGALWTAEARRTLEELDPETLTTIGSVRPHIPEWPTTQDGGEVAFGPNAVWFGSNHDTITRVDPATLRVVKTIRAVDVGPGGQIVADSDAVWVDDSYGNITELDPHTNDTVEETHLATSDAGGIAASSKAVWATAVDQGLVWEIDPQQLAPIQSFPVGADPTGVALGAGSVWVANAGGTLTRLNPYNGRTTTIRLADSPSGVTYADNLIWVSID
jgi:YVTN family beta-propeller protein